MSTTLSRRQWIGAVAAGSPGLAFLRPAGEATVYVAPGGRDTWSGRKAVAGAGDGPKATLTAARDALRGLAAGASKRIVVRGGKYFLEEPLLLDARDSGLVIEAHPEEAPAIYGGSRITGWRRINGDLWAASVPAAREGRWAFRLLTVNGRLAERSRLPEEGYFTHLSEFNVRWMSTTGGGWQRKPTAEELTTLRYRAGDLGDWFDPMNAELRVYHMWDESLVRAAEIDRHSQTIKFASPAGHPPGAFGVRKYVVWNLREGLRRPGQWCVDYRAGEVVYWPRPGEEMEHAEVIAPALESVIVVDGGEGRRVRDVVLRGLACAVTGTPDGAGGFGAGRYAGAVSFAHAENCALEGIEVFQAGGQGVRATDTAGLTIRNSQFLEVGACGVLARGSDIVVEDCRVRGVGRTYPSAIGLFCGGRRVTLAHNEVSETPYSAVNCGGQGHLIANNRLHHAMLELHDGAAIYSFAAKGVAMRGNFAHDIPDTGGYGSSAYYLDERSENSSVEGNLAVGVARPSHNHMAHSNTIRNNLFLHDGDMKATFPRSSGFKFEKNILSAAGRISFTPPGAISESAGNILHSRARVLEGAPDGVLIADPRLQELGPGRFGFGQGSPAPDLGIMPIDVSQAGPRKS